jgi:hypothetical protein
MYQYGRHHADLHPLLRIDGILMSSFTYYSPLMDGGIVAWPYDLANSK